MADVDMNGGDVRWKKQVSESEPEQGFGLLERTSFLLYQQSCPSYHHPGLCNKISNQLYNDTNTCCIVTFIVTIISLQLTMKAAMFDLVSDV